MSTPPALLMGYGTINLPFTPPPVATTQHITVTYRIRLAISVPLQRGLYGYDVYGLKKRVLSERVW